MNKAIDSMFPFLKTIRTFTRANLISLMFLCALLAILLIIVLVTAVTWLTADLVTLDRGWLDTLINWIVATVTGIGGWFMLPVFIVFIAGMFQEFTTHRVEKVYYPEQTRIEPPKLWPDLLHDIKFTLKALLLNLLVLPTYLLGIGFLVSIVLNSYLLGREFFESAAGYHLGKPTARELGRKHKKIIYAGGLVITLMTLTPLLNLLVPIFAIVWMVHVYHYLQSMPQKTA